MKNLLKFIQERFQPVVTVQLSVLLCAGPLSFFKFEAITAAVAIISVFFSLLSIRIADDIKSIDDDRITAPERGLPSGKIDRKWLNYSMIMLILLIFFINYPAGSPLAVILITIFYFLFFSIKQRIPFLARPLFSNLIFLIIPLYISFLKTGDFGTGYFFLGLFTCLSAVGHEYAHTVHGADECRFNLLTYSKIIGPRNSALLSLVFFTAAAVAGLLFWYYSSGSILFMIFLTFTSFQIFYLEIKLLSRPGMKNSRPFYIYGFTFFILPYLGLLIDNLMK